MAGLVLWRSRVSVGPPWLPVRPSLGSVFLRSPDAFSPQLSPAPSRLWPAELTDPRQFGPVPPAFTVFLDTIEFLRLTLPAPDASTPPPAPSAWLSESVSLSRKSVPGVVGAKSMAPPLLGP